MLCEHQSICCTTKHVHRRVCDLFVVPGDHDYSSVLLGMLVMQDVQLSLLIAVMPSLIQAQRGDLGGSVQP